jgi:hypothetical protein
MARNHDAWMEGDPAERKRERDREYYWQHRAQVRERKRQYYRTNAERVRAVQNARPRVRIERTAEVKARERARWRRRMKSPPFRKWNRERCRLARERRQFARELGLD